MVRQVDVEVFDIFDLSEYIFLELERGGVAGNTIVTSYSGTGVFKLRNSLTRGESAETKDSNSTLHIRPTEAFLSSLGNNLVGHGIQIFGKDYEIIGQTGGKNFHNGVMEHYTAILQETSFSDWGGSGS